MVIHEKKGKEIIGLPWEERRVHLLDTASG
jgi:hypothetical protein